LISAAALADDRLKDAWAISDRERAARRFDPGAAAIRTAKAIADGHHVPGNSKQYILLGSRNPELLMRWELMNYIVRAFDPDVSIRESARKQWQSRGAARLLGNDFLDKLHTVAREFIESELEIRRTTILLRTATDAERASLEELGSKANSVNCGARADALASARRLFGEAAFDAFLYRVLAPDAVLAGEIGSSPEAMLDTHRWIEAAADDCAGCRGGTRFDGRDICTFARSIDLHRQPKHRPLIHRPRAE
jgi:hypothetical protein